MSTPNIVFVGHVCVDHNSIEGKRYTKWGSPAMFMATYLQSVMAIQPMIIASYGKDFVPFKDHVQLYPNKPNLKHSLGYENIVADGHRTQYCYHAESHSPPTFTPALRALLGGADIVFFAPLTPYFSNDYVAKCMSHVRSDSLRVLLPQGYMRHIDTLGLVSPREFIESDTIIPLFDLVTLSDEDHPEAIARSHLWKQHSPGTNIIVTRNARGADIVSAHSVKHIPTDPVAPDDIIDSVGCGDVFTAATALQLYRTRDLEAAIKSGHAAARTKLLALNQPTLV